MKFMKKGLFILIVTILFISCSNMMDVMQEQLEYYNLPVYTITYTSDYGTVPEVKTVKEGYVITAEDLQSLSQEGYIFDGWFISEEQMMEADYVVSSDITLVGKWETVSYRVKYFDADFELKDYEPNAFNIEKGLDSLAAAEKRGYIFKGWYSDSTFENLVENIPAGTSEDVILYSKWEPIVYTITYVANDGVFVNEELMPHSYTIETAESIVLPTAYDISKVECEFKGWFDWSEEDGFLGSEIASFSKNSIGNVTLYAKWRNFDQLNPVHFSVTGDVDYNDEVILTCDEDASIFYTLDGNEPTTSSTLYSAPIKITDDVSVKAISVKSGLKNSEVTTKNYTVKHYSVNYDLNGVEGTVPAGGSFVKGEKIILADALSVHGKDFDVWKEGQKDYSAGSVFTVGTNDVTFKAVWVCWKTVENVTFSCFGSVDFGDSLTLSTTTKDATIYYTTDGSEPTRNSNKYAEEIILNHSSSSETVKAIAVKEGMLDSEVTSEEYTYKKYKITFNNYDHNGSYKILYKKKGDEITLPTGASSFSMSSDESNINQTFVSPSGINFQPQTYSYSCLGYSLINWKLGEDDYQINEKYTVGAEDVTFETVWKNSAPIPNQINFSVKERTNLCLTLNHSLPKEVDIKKVDIDLYRVYVSTWQQDGKTHGSSNTIKCGMACITDCYTLDNVTIAVEGSENYATEYLLVTIYDKEGASVTYNLRY